MNESRENKIDDLAREGELNELKVLLGKDYSQLEINSALSGAIAYSRIETAEFLISIGAELSYMNYDGVYYAVHNNEFAGLKFAVENGVSVDINNGELLNESIITAYNSKDTSIIEWLLKKGANTNLLSENTLKNFGTKKTIELIKKTPHNNV